MNLRYVIRDGEKILQVLTSTPVEITEENGISYMDEEFKWVDVEVEKE